MWVKCAMAILKDVCVLVLPLVASETAVTECEWLYHFCLRGKLPRSIKDLPAVLDKVNA